MKFRGTVIVCCLVGFGFHPGVLVSASTWYRVTDLGSLSGTTRSAAKSINDNGQIVGAAYLDTGVPQAFLYSGGGPMQELGSPASTIAYAINNSGEAVGVSNDRAAIFVPDGSPIALNGLVPQFRSAAAAVNDSGEIVGTTFTDSTIFNVQAFSYSGNGPAQLIGTLGGTRSNAYGINNSGQIVGAAYLSNGNGHAFLYDGNGPMQDLGTLGGPFSAAEDINNHGQIVGFAAINGNDFHAFLYSGNGPMQDLGILPGESFGHAYSINDNGEIVGISRDADLVWHAFLFSDGEMHDLNTLIDPTSGWWVADAQEINNRGQIVGYGHDSSGQQHALLLTPVPEPSAFVLFTISTLGLLAGYGQRRASIRSSDRD